MEASNKPDIHSIEKSYIHAAKVAMAIAVIKKKPANLTTRQYTQQLCSDYVKSQHVWKTKYESAEEEILNLRQQMLIVKNKTREPDKWTFSQTEVSDIEMMPNSEPLFPTPPSSSSTEKKGQSTFFHKNTIFLQSIISMKQTLAQSNEKHTIQQITKQTIMHNLEIINSGLTDDKLKISSLNMIEGIKCVVELSDILYGKDYRDVQIKIAAILEGLVVKLLSIDGLDQVSVDIKEKFQNLIMSFTETEHLNYLASTINILMIQCETFCYKLRETQQMDSTINCITYENMFYVIQCILLCVHRKVHLMCSPGGKRLCESLQLRIDNSLLHITGTFPLVTHSMWKISSILQTYMQDAVKT